ncbi:MAG TPA: LysE family translocator [Candidatus Thioglobus sp.]|nr:LysE family translocator [Candidatus Thioglobus sp.]HIL21316.1 LysE family translocator [Candidatus Thioglobus sp.]
MNEYILSALIFGLTAGLQPGPLSILVVQQTLERGLFSGIKVSFAPVITDGPIIFAVAVVLTQFKDISLFIGILSLVGGLYLGLLCVKTLQVKEVRFSGSSDTSSSLLTAIKVNFLSPNPYLFWFTVGGTYFALGATNEAIVFVLVFLSSLVLSKIAIALVASKFRESLESRAYLWIMRALGLALGVFAISFLIKSYELLL